MYTGNTTRVIPSLRMLLHSSKTKLHRTRVFRDNQIHARSRILQLQTYRFNNS